MTRGADAGGETHNQQGFRPCYSKDSTLSFCYLMSKITSKYQVTIPKRIAEKYNIHPGDDIDWIATGEVIRVIPSERQALSEDRESRLRLFDQATKRHRGRVSPQKSQRPTDRGWKREDLYTRGRSR